MRRFKLYYAVSMFILLTTVFQLSWADLVPIAASCKAKSVTDPLVKGRASSIHFPNGRVVTVVGHLHGERQIYKVAQLIQEGKLSTMSDEEFTELIESIQEQNKAPLKGLILNSNRRSAKNMMRQRFGAQAAESFDVNGGYDLSGVTVLNHAQQDHDFLQKMIQKNNEKIQFVGYEGTESIWHNNLPIYLRTQQALLSEISIRKKKGWKAPSAVEIKNLLLSSSNGNVYSYMEDPNLMKRIPMVGVEDESAGQAHQQADPLVDMGAKFKAWGASTDTLPEAQLSPLTRDQKFLGYATLVSSLYLAVESMEITSSDELESRIKHLKSYNYPWTQAAQENLFTSMRQRLRLNSIRDSASAQNLASINRTGVHFVGLNHLRNTIQNLEQICSRELTGAGPGGSVYSNQNLLK